MVAIRRGVGAPARNSKVDLTGYNFSENSYLVGSPFSISTCMCPNERLTKIIFKRIYANLSPNPNS